MALRVFERLYPKLLNLNGEPTGLETSTTKSLHIMECELHNMEHLDAC